MKRLTEISYPSYIPIVKSHVLSFGEGIKKRGFTQGLRKGIFLLTTLLSLFFFKAEASHLMGGEITWECQGSGKYIFKLKFYRDCNGAPVSSSVSLRIYNHPTDSIIYLTRILQTDISPTCNNAGPAITCAAAAADTANYNPGAVQESVYQSAAITLSGIPPPQGWAFVYSDCCRNGSVSNLQNANTDGFTLRATMYSYNGKNANPCFDSSPTFLESPSTVICLGAPFKYNHNAYDRDLDSLSFSFAEPLDKLGSGTYAAGTNPAPLHFTNGYSYNSPLPGTTQNPANVPAVINSKTGEIAFTSFTQGYFVTVVKVQAWKCGTLVSEIFREIEVVLLPCATNATPTVTYTSYQNTVPAGTLVSFTLSGHDSGTLPDGTAQSVTINASGTQFGTGFTNASAGCLNPPCATLSASLPVSAPTNISTTFNWQTSCNHISYNTICNTVSNTYTFVFRVKDDFCPAPSENISTVSITVVATPVVQSPKPQCVSVLPNGDVTLTWATPADTAHTFTGYFIYTSTSPGGPFTLLDSVLTYTQTTYTHTGANANTPTSPVHYYYIRTRSGCFGLVYSPPVDTVSSMHLNLTNIVGSGVAPLSWNPVASPNISTSTGLYTVYQEYPASIWTATGSTTNLNFIDTIFLCSATINYKVEIADNSGCTSVSSIQGGSFQNKVPPNAPVFDTLSVDNNNNALMSWYIDPAPDVKKYVIYKVIGGVNTAVDTVFGINNIGYNYLSSNADLGSETYLLAAIDSCGNLGLQGNRYSTIFLTSSPEICLRSVVLNWTAYPAIGTGLAAYRVYQSMVGMTGPFTLIGTIPAGTLTDTVKSLAPQTTYYFKIQAVDSSLTKTASSNRIRFFSATPIPPVFSYLRKATVFSPNQVDLTCHIDVVASTLKYKIMRSLDSVSAHYIHIGSVPKSAVSPILYSDTKVLTDNNSYYYKIINVDSCGFDGMQTNIGRTMLLRAISNSPAMTNTLTWNDYENWSGNVLSYNIYRGIDSIMDPTPINSIPLPFTGSGINTYTDDVSSLLQGEGVFDYYVEALEGIGDVYGFSENSLSNIATAYQDPLVFIPNAFKPEGKIDKDLVFIPVTTYINFTEYQFSVFNRWGKEVFTTNDLKQGWDGTDKGKKCEFGVYVYLLRFKSSKGEYLDFKGSVTLLR